MTFPEDEAQVSPKKPGKRWLLAGAAILLGVLVLSAAGFAWLFLYAKAPGPLVDSGQTVYIPPRTGFKDIQQQLVSAGVIRQDVRFFLLAGVLSSANRLKSGEYRFAPGVTPYQVLKVLEQGDSIKHVVTFPEGINIYQLAETLAQKKLLAAESFLGAAKDKDLLQELGIGAETFEGYLFPDTYYLTRMQTPEDIIRMMVARGQEVISGLGGLADNELHLSVHEILTLASIVEKEAATPVERRLVARVFFNRLQQGMLLQTDPTVIYGLENFNGNLTRRDLKSASPYNTYLVKGLPPGPIANPGRAAIDAVLHPAEGKYLFFVSKNDGTHHFSVTLQEHNSAVARYQRPAQKPDQEAPQKKSEKKRKRKPRT